MKYEVRKEHTLSTQADIIYPVEKAKKLVVPGVTPGGKKKKISASGLEKRNERRRQWQFEKKEKYNLYLSYDR